MAMFAIQVVISILHIGSWFTLAAVRVPRILTSCCLGSCTMRVQDLSRRKKCIKSEGVIRLVTLILYFLISFGFSVYLPKEFCHLFDGVFSSRRTEDEMSSCIWQLFGFRMIFMLICLPIELICYFIVRRHSNDLAF